MTAFALGGGLAAWTIQLLASYALIDFGCDGATAAFPLVAPLLAVSVACAAIAAGATAVATDRALSTHGGVRAMYTAAALLDALSLMTIAFGAVLPFAFGPCARP